MRASRLSAKVDNTAIQDGFQIYMHSFIVTDKGEWAVIQQGMNKHTGMARRYHWHSAQLKSFVENPHTFVYGQNQGKILNLADGDAKHARSGIVAIVKEDPQRIVSEIKKILTYSAQDLAVTSSNLKSLFSVIALAHEKGTEDFESLLLLEGVGPRTIYLLALASNGIYDTSLQFTDPAGFPFVYSGKNDPSSILLKEYEEAISDMRALWEKSRMADADESKALQNLTEIATQLERGFEPREMIGNWEKKKVEAPAHSHRAKGPQQVNLFPKI
jgi:hypothetical protein